MNKGYAICLNEWLDDTRIKSELSLLLRISSLCAKEGYCFASNSYFAEKTGVKEVSISRKLKKLKEFGYISIEYEKRGCEVTRRLIRLSIKQSTIIKNDNRRLSKMITDDYQKRQSTIIKNDKDNNTSINNTSINKKTTTKKNDFKPPNKKEAAMYFTNSCMEKLRKIGNYSTDNRKILANFHNFWDYYENKNWDDVANWKNRINTWVNKMFARNANCIRDWTDKDVYF